MPYELENRLVIGVASSAMFDLSESDAVFRESGEEEYRRYQERNIDVALEQGVAFHFVRRLLSLNDLSDVANPLVEVVLLSRNDPDTGMRVMKSMDDESESVMQSKSLEAFHAHEAKNVMRPHNPGPLTEFLKKINVIQSVELEKKKLQPGYSTRLRVSIVTARNAPSHERALNTLKSWGVMVNDAFFLGGVEKRRVLQVLSPHIFFDDQAGHLVGAATVVPSVHIPFGVTNI